MADRYWRDTSPPYGYWGTNGNWSATISGAGNFSFPVATDLAWFNNSVATGSLLKIYLNNAAGRSVLGLRFNSYSASGLEIYGGTEVTPAQQTLTIGSSGVIVDSGTSPTIDGTVTLVAGAAQTWTINGGLYNNALQTSLAGSTHAFGGSGTLFWNSPLLNTSGGTQTVTKSGTGTIYFGVASGSYANANWSLSAATYSIGADNVFGGSTVAVTVPASATLATVAFGGTVTHTLANSWIIDGSISLGRDAVSGAYQTWFTWTGNVNIAADSTWSLLTSVNNNSFNITISGALNSASALTWTIGGTTTYTSDVYLQGSAGTLSGTVSVGTNRRLFLGASGSGTPSQLNAVSTITGTGSLFIRGATAYTFASAITGSLPITVENPDITFSSANVSSTGAFSLSAVTANGLTQTQRARFNNAASFGTASSYNYTTAAATWTNLKQVLEFAGGADKVQTKALNLTNSVASGSTYTASLKNSSAFLLTQQGNVVYARATISTKFELDTASGPITLTGIIQQTSTGVLSVVKSGADVATLSGANTFQGNYENNAGTTKANNALALGTNNAATVSVASGSALSLDVACNYNAGKVLALAGVGAGTGSGALILNNASTNTFSGGVTANGPTYIRGTASGELTSTITSSGAIPALRLGAAAGVVATFSGVISGTNSFLIGRSNNVDTGTVVLTGLNTFLAPTQIDYGKLQIDTDSRLGQAPSSPTADYLLIGATAGLAGALSASATFTLNANRGVSIGPASAAGTGTIEVVSGQRLTYNGVIANRSGGTGTLAKTGAGTLDLGSANTYSGGTDLTNGTLRANHLTALGSGSVSQAAGTVLQTAQSNGRLRITGTYTHNGGTLRIGGA